MAKETRPYWRMRLDQSVCVKRIKSGKYSARRCDDGREFLIIRGEREWVVEAQDTLSLDGAPTLTTAILSIARRWTPQSRELAHG